MEARTFTLSDLAAVFDGADGVLMLLRRDDLDLFVVTKTPRAGEPILFTEAVLLYVALVYEVAGLRAAGTLSRDEVQAIYSQLVCHNFPTSGRTCATCQSGRPQQA